MLKNLLQNKTKVFYILLLLSLLVTIRAFENRIFYDPLLTYFKRNYMQTPLPKLNVIKLFFSMGFRFYLNSIISIGLLKMLFDDSKVVKFSIFPAIIGLFILVVEIGRVPFVTLLTLFCNLFCCIQNPAPADLGNFVPKP